MKKTINKFKAFEIKSKELKKLKGGDDDAASDLGSMAADAAPNTSPANSTSGRYQGALGHF